MNISLKGILESKDHVITTELEHNSVLRPLYELEKKGIELTIIRSDGKGFIHIEDIRRAIRKNTGMIVSTQIVSSDRKFDRYWKDSANYSKAWGDFRGGCVADRRISIKRSGIED